MMTPEQFVLLQQILINAMWPFIQFWVMMFLVAAISASLLIFFLMITRELVMRV